MNSPGIDGAGKETQVFKVALVGPELEENLSLRYLASSLAAAGFECEIVPFNSPNDLPRVLAVLLDSGERPGLVGLSLSFQRRAKDFFALSIALRQKGYAGHITAGGHFGTFACREILRDFPEIDSICRHEAEETLASLARALTASEARWRSRKQGVGAPLVGALPSAWPIAEGGHKTRPYVGRKPLAKTTIWRRSPAWHTATLRVTSD